MPADVLIGIDLGTTVLKAYAFDERTGRQLACADRRLPVEADHTGRREQSSADVCSSVRHVFATLKRSLGHRWKQVRGVGLAAQGGSCVLADRQTGKAHSPLLLWNDMRFMPLLGEVSRGRDARYWRKFSWRDEPGWGLARILWLRKTHPQWLKRGAIYAGAGDYLYFCLTGQWRQDAGNALQIGCFNVPKRQLDPAPLALVDADLSLVAPLRDGHASCPLSRNGAELLGLPQGLPVVGPYMDHEAAYQSVVDDSRSKNSSRRGPLQMSLGTAWVGNFVLPENASWSSPFQLVLPAPTTAGWLVVQPLLTGNVTWDWAMQTFLADDHATALKRVGGVFHRALMPPEGLTALPWLNMPNPLQPGAMGGGSFFGLGPRASAQDLVRTIAAAMTFETRRVLHEVISGGSVSSVILGGGASAAGFFQSLLGAAFDPLPVRILTDSGSAGARGSLYGLNARIAHSPSQTLRRPSSRILHDWQRGYEAYLRLFERLYGHVANGGPVQFRRTARSRSR